MGCWGGGFLQGMHYNPPQESVFCSGGSLDPPGAEMGCWGLDPPGVEIGYHKGGRGNRWSEVCNSGGCGSEGVCMGAWLRGCAAQRGVGFQLRRCWWVWGRHGCCGGRSIVRGHGACAGWVERGHGCCVSGLLGVKGAVRVGREGC